MVVLFIVSTSLTIPLLNLMWMSFDISARTVGRVDVITAAMSVFASVIQSAQSWCLWNTGKAAEVPQLQEQFEGASLWFMLLGTLVAMADQEKPEASSAIKALSDMDKRW